MAQAIPATERAAIVAALRSGGSIGQVARESGRSKFTVSKIANAEGIDTNVSATKKATAARTEFAQAGRLELSNELFAKVRQTIPTVADAGDLKDLATAFGILTDKRRLEEGEATERHEYSDSARDRIARRLDELAARRRTREVAI